MNAKDFEKLIKAIDNAEKVSITIRRPRLLVRIMERLGF